LLFESTLFILRVDVMYKVLRENSECITHYRCWYSQHSEDLSNILSFSKKL